VRAVVVVVLAVAVGLLGWAVQRGEAARRGDETVQRERQRRDVGLLRPPIAARPEQPARRGHCVQGADGFATAVERQVSPLAAGAKRLASFLHLSDLAIRAERRAELSRPAPTLPRRLGVEAGVAVDPPREACAGKGFAEID
jgi:hypothetical protein